MSASSHNVPRSKRRTREPCHEPPLTAGRPKKSPFRSVVGGRFFPPEKTPSLIENTIVRAKTTA